MTENRVTLDGLRSMQASINDQQRAIANENPDNVKTLILNRGHVEEADLFDIILFNAEGFDTVNDALDNLSRGLVCPYLYDLIEFAEYSLKGALLHKPHRKKPRVELDKITRYDATNGNELFPVINFDFTTAILRDILRTKLHAFSAYDTISEDGWYLLVEALEFANPFNYRTYKVDRAPDVLAQFYLNEFDEVAQYLVNEVKVKY